MYVMLLVLPLASVGKGKDKMNGLYWKSNYYE